jgi:hypothetical protein
MANLGVAQSDLLIEFHLALWHYFRGKVRQCSKPLLPVAGPFPAQICPRHILQPMHHLSMDHSRQEWDED